MAGSTYRFSVGPWNLSDGADPFGVAVRKPMAFAKKVRTFKDLGFDAVMFHDDDIVPDIDNKTPQQVAREAKAVRRMLQGLGMEVEVFAPRLWEHPKWADGGYTANDARTRRAAIERSKRSIDVGREVGCDLMVFWLAREGTYLREAKDPLVANNRILEAIDACLDYDPQVRIAIEPKPNEPMDVSYVPTVGHALALGGRSRDPERVGGLIESAHATLLGLDPSDEMAFALAAGKLWSVHLNDQNGLKYDQDRSFGSVNLRVAYNQVRVLEQAGFANTGCVAFDTKPVRTSTDAMIARHLSNSKQAFEWLVEKHRTLDEAAIEQARAARDYEAIDEIILAHLLGRKPAKPRKKK